MSDTKLNTYKFHLRSGTTITFKAKDVIVTDNGQKFTKWEVISPDKWFMFMPGDVIAVERVK